MTFIYLLVCGSEERETETEAGRTAGELGGAITQGSDEQYIYN